MLAKQYIGKIMTDEAFDISQRAKLAMEKYGKKTVINSTLGALYDENENLVVFDVIKELYHILPITEFTAYAPHFTGSEQYKESVKKWILGKRYQEEYEELYSAVFATSGGTGAIYSSIKNYLNYGDSILLPNYMWGSYKAIAREAGGAYVCYQLFNENNEFHLEDFEKKINTLAEKQENVLVMINDPCHNPTGYKLKEKEWLSVMDIIRKACQKANVILIKDIAYKAFDVATYSEKMLLKNLPENLLIIYAFSLSKSLGIYGMRVGAQLAVSSKKELITEFKQASAFSCRTTWSNVSRGGMELFSVVMNDEKLKRSLVQQREEYRKLLDQRASIFMEEAKKCNLFYLPYHSGFFLAVPIGEKVREVMQELEKKNIFTIVFGDAIRIAICSIPLRKIKGLAFQIKECIDSKKG